jgi:hypothetical protein
MLKPMLKCEVLPSAEVVDPGGASQARQGAGRFYADLWSCCLLEREPHNNL